MARDVWRERYLWLPMCGREEGALSLWLAMSGREEGVLSLWLAMSRER